MPTLGLGATQMAAQSRPQAATAKRAAGVVIEAGREPDATELAYRQRDGAAGAEGQQVGAMFRWNVSRS